MTRLTDANGTYGLAVESPEPVSLTRDVTVTPMVESRRSRRIAHRLGAAAAVHRALTDPDAESTLAAGLGARPAADRCQLRTMTVTSHGRCAISQAGTACRQAASLMELIVAVPACTARTVARAGRPPG